MGNDPRKYHLRLSTLLRLTLLIMVGALSIMPGLLAAQDKDPVEQADHRAILGNKAPEGTVAEKEPAAPLVKMTLTSEAFTYSDVIPARYSCEGNDLSPPLSWSDVPDGTRAFALICDDPDAPVGTWDHWVIFNLSGEMTSLPAGITTETDLGGKVRHGLNSWQRTGYGGPCPPPGKPHRYFFRLYALSAPVNLEAEVTKAELLEAITPLIVGLAELMGIYSR